MNKKYSFDGIELSKEGFESKHKEFNDTFPNHPLTHLNDFKLGGGTLIESGSLYGDSIYRALNFGYSKVISVEINEELYDYVCDRFSTEISDGSVEIHLGSSIDVLPKVLEGINEPVTFWLDAHLHGKSFGKTNDAPIIKELELINNHKIKNHTILIDDMRIIRGASWGSGKLDSVVLESISKINNDYTISYGHGIVDNDVLIAEMLK
jgi:hypothetical protein